MNRKHTLLNILTITFLCLGVGVAIATTKNNSTAKVEIAEAGEGNYYSSISDSLTGTALLNALHTLNTQKKTKDVTYGKMRQFAAKSDIDPDGSGKIIGFYDNKKIGPSWDSGSTWNREHVWPNVRDGDLVEDDAHMVRPASTSTNSGRGSKGFGKESYDPGGGNNVDYYRGAAARIIFYAAIANTNLTIVDFPFNYDGVSDGNSGYPVGAMGCLSDMLEWNLQYLPQDTSFTGADDLARRTELNRNEVIQNDTDGQGNRNPFIDHPEYACKIWGNTNAKTKAICGMSKTVTLDKTTYTAHVGDYFTIKATSSDSTAITWSATGSAVSIGEDQTASGTPVNVKALAVGSSTITATSASGATATCTVTVKEVATYISLTTTGQKTNYLVGEEFSYDGVCKANYSDGTSKEVTPIVTAHGNTSAPGNFEVDLSYTENGITKVTSYTVTVNKAPAVLQSITTSGQSEIFSIGDEFKYDGTCIAHYDDGSEKDVTDMVDVRTPLNVTKKAGTYKVSLEYMEKGNLVKTSYQITVEPGMDPKPADKKKVTLPTWVIVTMCVGGGGLVIGIAIAIIVIVNKKKA